MKNLAKRILNINPEVLCDYGCGNIAYYIYKNGKNCCSDNHSKCLAEKKRNSKSSVEYNKNIGREKRMERFYKTRETIKNKINEEGLDGYQQSARKAAKTKRDDIDENGLNMHQRSAIKVAEIKRNNIDENGQDMHQIGALKAAQTRIEDVDENGLNGYQRTVQKIKDDIDENSLNYYERINQRIANEGHLDIDSNGLSRHQRSAIKTANTMLNSINPDSGLNTYQENAIKTRETKSNNINEEGLNIFQQAAEKGYETKIINGTIIPRELKSKKERYYIEVAMETEKSWMKHYNKINPERQLRNGKYHLDHIYSKIEGFKNDISPKIIGHWTNLRIIESAPNIIKGSKCDKTLKQLLEDYEEYTNVWNE